MRKILFLGLLFVILLYFGTTTSQAITIGFDPVTQGVGLGNSVDVDLVISGLGNYAPDSLTQAEKLKNKKGRNFYLAGGTLLNWRGFLKANSLIDLKNLGLGGINASQTKITIGAAVTIQEIAESRKVPAALSKAAGDFTSINIRNIATLGGTVTGNFFISRAHSKTSAKSISHCLQITRQLA